MVLLLELRCQASAEFILNGFQADAFGGLDGNGSLHEKRLDHFFVFAFFGEVVGKLLFTQHVDVDAVVFAEETDRRFDLVDFLVFGKYVSRHFSNGNVRCRHKLTVVLGNGLHRMRCHAFGQVGVVSAVTLLFGDLVVLILEVLEDFVCKILVLADAVAHDELLVVFEKQQT